MNVKKSRLGWIGALAAAIFAGTLGLTLLEREGELDAAADVSPITSTPRKRMPIPNLDGDLTYMLPENDADALVAAAELALSKSAALDRSDKLVCSGDGVAYAEFPGADSPFLDRYVGAEVEPGIFITSFEVSDQKGEFLVCVESKASKGISLAEFEASGLSATNLAESDFGNNALIEELEIPLPIAVAGSSFGGYLATGGVAAASIASLIKVRTTPDPPISR